MSTWEGGEAEDDKREKGNWSWGGPGRDHQPLCGETSGFSVLGKWAYMKRHCNCAMLNFPSPEKVRLQLQVRPGWGFMLRKRDGEHASLVMGPFVGRGHSL